MKFLSLIFRNVSRNRLRSALTALGTIVLVFVVSLVWSILAFLDRQTEEKSQDLRAMVTERWSLPSRMPFAYADSLARGAARAPGDVVPYDSMTWQFYAGTVDREKLTRESVIYAIACDPPKLLTMMEGLDTLPPAEDAELRACVERLNRNRQAVILGRNQLAALNKRVGDRINLQGIANLKGIDLELEIVGVFPPGRYDIVGAIHRDYFNQQMDAYPRTHRGRSHPLANRSLNLVWIKVRNTEEFTRVAAQIEHSPFYSIPAVKCETASSGVAAFMEAFRDLIWGMRWLLAPACLVTLALVIANSISISVRERRLELAVLKVLGFRPIQLLGLVLGEALLLGAGAGFVSAALTWLVVDFVLGGISFPMGFFSTFFIPAEALWWGPAVGGLAALAGSILPALSARNVRVADVFSKVA